MRLAVLLALTIAVPAAAAPPPSQPKGFVSLPAIQAPPSDAVTQIYTREVGRDTPSMALERLNRWCKSERAADKKRCESAWQRINAEYSRMQAEKTAG